MIRQWSCMHCSTSAPLENRAEIQAHKGVTFYSEKPEDKEAPVCPKCGIDGGDPAFRGYIQPIVVTHFEPPHASGAFNKGSGVLACTGGPVKTAKVMYLADPRLVLCPACKATAAYKTAIAAFDNPAEYAVYPVPAPAAPSEVK